MLVARFVVDLALAKGESSNRGRRIVLVSTVVVPVESTTGSKTM